MASKGGDAAGLRHELEAHRRALVDVIESAAYLDSASWNEPRADGRWYETVLDVTLPNGEPHPSRRTHGRDCEGCGHHI